MTDKPETQQGPKLQKFSLTQLGWENPCCLRHPILQANQREKFVYFASQVDELKSAYQELQKELDQLKQIINEPGSKGRMYILMKAERDEWKAQAEALSDALKYYSEMRFNREKQVWMPGNPDKAIGALAAYEKWKGEG